MSSSVGGSSGNKNLTQHRKLYQIQSGNTFLPTDLDFFEYDDKDSDVAPPQNLVQQTQSEWGEVCVDVCVWERDWDQ